MRRFCLPEGETLGFRYLSASLARYGREASRHYNLGNYGSTKLFLQRATDFCIACHSRLPSPGDSPLARDFIADSELAKLPAAERASLAVRRGCAGAPYSKDPQQRRMAV
ncbi:MAG: hypothetical protein ACREX4_02785 [Gammaproteobacteria bacterium]